MKKSFISVCSIVSAPIFGCLSGLGAIIAAIALGVFINNIPDVPAREWIVSVLTLPLPVWLSCIFDAIGIIKDIIFSPNHFSSFNYIPLVLFFCFIFILAIIIAIDLLYYSILEKNDSITMKIISASIYLLFFIFTVFHLSYDTIKGILESIIAFNINSIIGWYYTLLSIITLYKAFLIYAIFDTTEPEDEPTTEKQDHSATTEN